MNEFATATDAQLMAIASGVIGLMVYTLEHIGIAADDRNVRRVDYLITELATRATTSS